MSNQKQGHKERKIEREKTPSIAEDEEEKPRQNKSNPLRNPISARHYKNNQSIIGIGRYRRRRFS